jgi:hypothetical protein
MSVYLVLDVWNLVRMKRAAQKEPEAIEKKVPRT